MKVSISLLRKFRAILKYFDAFLRSDAHLLHYIRLLISYRFHQSSFFPSSFSTLYGCRFSARANTIDILHLSRFFEPETMRFLLRSNPSFFIDVGSHIGVYSVVLASRGSKVVSIDATIEALDQLRYNLNLNNCSDNVIAVNLACSDVPGKGYMYIHPFNQGANCLQHEFVPGEPQREIEISTLDNIINKFSVSIDSQCVVKIDAEGAELSILKGSTNLLASSKVTFILECLDIDLRAQVIDYFMKFDYHYKCDLDDTNMLFIPSCNFCS